MNNFVYFGKTVQFQWFSDDWWEHTAAQCQDCREHSLQCQTFTGGSFSVGGNVQIWKCSVAKGFFLVQADAILVDSSGKHFPVHGYLLKLLFPVFRGIKLRKDQVIILDGVSGEEVMLLIGLAYGRGRWDFSNFWENKLLSEKVSKVSILWISNQSTNCYTVTDNRQGC